MGFSKAVEEISPFYARPIYVPLSLPQTCHFSYCWMVITTLSTLSHPPTHTLYTHMHTHGETGRHTYAGWVSTLTHSVGINVVYLCHMHTYQTHTRTPTRTYIDTHTTLSVKHKLLLYGNKEIYIYIYKYIFVCVHVCLCAHALWTCCEACFMCFTWPQQSVNPPKLPFTTDAHTQTHTHGINSHLCSSHSNSDGPLYPINCLRNWIALGTLWLWLSKITSQIASALPLSSWCFSLPLVVCLWPRANLLCPGQRGVRSLVSGCVKSPGGRVSMTAFTWTYNPVMSLIHGSDHILFTFIQRPLGIHTPVYMINILVSDWCIWFVEAPVMFIYNTNNF